jgi:proteasome lid subunit RPN8/RPN11
MVLKLSLPQLQTIRSHATSSYPEECCGLLLGKVVNDEKRVVEVIPTRNAWNTEALAWEDSSNHGKVDRYAIAPQEMLKIQKAARDRYLDIIGIYHSHPNHPAIPSECDRIYAWQQYSYIIVSVVNGECDDVQNWTLDDRHQFQSEMIVAELV